MHCVCLPQELAHTEMLSALQHVEAEEIYIAWSYHKEKNTCIDKESVRKYELTLLII